MQIEDVTPKELIAKPETIEAQVAAWSATDADLKAAVEATNGITVAGHADGPKKGREAVHKALMDLTGLRTSIEARRLELKRPILDLGKLVDTEAKRLTAITEPREIELRKDRDTYDTEQKRIREEAERLERERLAAEEKARREAEEAEAKRVRAEAFARLTDRVNRVTAAGGAPDLAWLTTAGDDEVDSLVARLERERAEREAAMERERIEREKAEAEEKLRREELARQEEEARKIREAAEANERAERAEADRLAREEQERIAAANKAEADRLAAERAAFERAQAEARAAEARAAAAKAEQERVEREAAAAAAEAERQRIEAECEAARIAAEAPDREKALAWCRVLVLPPLPEVESAAIREALELTATDIRHRVSLLEREMAENG